MFLSKQQNGIYYIYWQNLQGKKRSKSTGTKNRDEAIKFLHAIQKKIEKEFTQEVPPISLKKYFFDYLRHAEPYFTWKTIKANQTTFKYFQRAFGPETELATITRRMVEEYLLRRATEGSLFVARRDHINLSAALNKAVLDGYLLENPLKGIRKYKLPERQPRFYSKEDFHKLISVMNNQDMRELVIFAVNTGLRQMELITLTWAQVNIDEKFITLHNREHVTKSKRVRTIPLNPDALEVLKNRLTRRTDLFPNVFSLSNKPLNPNNLSQRFKKYVYVAKIDPKLNFHSLRHTFASWMIQNGVSIYFVSKLLGHSSVKTTEIYAHLRRDDLVSAVNSITQKRLITSDIEH